MSETLQPQWLEAEWDAPASVRALVTTRNGGCSEAPWNSLNLGLHVGDDPDHVLRNRMALLEALDLRRAPQWLEQVHGTEVVIAGESGQQLPQADAVISRTPGLAAVVMTADCLPVFLCDSGGSEVAVAHAGWRGLCDGVLENTVRRMEADPSVLRAWLGPAIGPRHFEVGPEVRDAFVRHDPHAEACFMANGEQSGKYLADLYALATQRLNRAGVDLVSGGNYCTFADSGHYYSYRRDGVTGRMASLIYIKEQTACSLI